MNLHPKNNAEIQKALKAIHRDQAAGEDHVRADLLKAVAQTVSRKTGHPAQAMYNHAAPPESWKKANIILILKKGDVYDGKNYRAISLLSVENKVYTKVIDYLNQYDLRLQSTKS